MLSIKSDFVDVCKSSKSEQETWAKLMSEHYSNEKDQFSPEFFLEYIRKNYELTLAIDKDISDAFYEVFSGKRGDRLNVGIIEDKCDERIQDHFYKLSICDPHVIIKQEKRLDRLSKKDFTWIDKELETMEILDEQKDDYKTILELDEHLTGILKGDPYAIKREEEIAKELAKEDFSDLKKELERL